ncbi:hypothetical protein B0H16DRAFT_1753032 [Mycena metata]|uniref:Uncharacterized protein n=1 Tax=Mycena metata TaxID=1033252 RepID=A0AAD7DDE2_9AGAR|nr:hypothetical protein B0H16DRAFT_1753032 [Mycena metata]
MPSLFPPDHDARILYPLMELAKQQVLLIGARSDYTEYDSHGRFEPASLLFSHTGTVQNAQHNVILSSTPLRFSPLALGFTDSPALLEDIAPDGRPYADPLFDYAFNSVMGTGSAY